MAWKGLCSAIKHQPLYRNKFERVEELYHYKNRICRILTRKIERKQRISRFELGGVAALAVMVKVETKILIAVELVLVVVGGEVFSAQNLIRRSEVNN